MALPGAIFFREGMNMFLSHHRLAATLCLLPLIWSIPPAQACEEGRATYAAVCSACHAPENVMVDSPKAGDTAEWDRRLRKGMEAVIDNAVAGLGAMPPKGGRGDLSRDKIRWAIEFMMTYRPANR